MRGIKTQPATIIDIKKNVHKTKAEIESRKRNEPRINSTTLQCPDDLSASAKKEWERIIDLYSEFKEPIMCNLDSNILQVYCEAVARYKKAMAEVRKQSEVIKIDNVVKANPWLRVANDAAESMRKMGELLLLDPVSRARVGLAKTKTEEDPMKYMYGD